MSFGISTQFRLGVAQFPLAINETYDDFAPVWKTRFRIDYGDLQAKIMSRPYEQFFFEAALLGTSEKIQ